jgi:hypothetical protein
METWRHGDIETWSHGDIDMKTWKHGDMETWRHGNMKTWKHEDMETWRHGDTETWRYVDMDMDTCRHAHGDIKQKTEAHENFLNLITIRSSCKRKLVIHPFVDKETNVSYPLVKDKMDEGYTNMLFGGKCSGNA